MYSGYAEQLKTIKNTHLSSTIYIADMTGQCRISRGNGRAVGRGIKAPIFWFFGPPLCSKCSFALGGGSWGGGPGQSRSGQVMLVKFTPEGTCLGLFVKILGI